MYTVSDNLTLSMNVFLSHTSKSALVFIFLCLSKIYLRMYPVRFPCGSLHDIYRTNRIPLWSCLFPGCIVTWAWSLAKGQYIIINIIITFLFTQGMPKQLKTGFHWGPACVNIKIEYREYGNPRGNSLPAPQFRGNQVYKLRRSAQENLFLMTVLSRNACIIA